MKNSKNLNNERKKLSNRIYTVGFVEENLTHNLNKKFKIFNDQSYDPVNVDVKEGDLYRNRKLINDIKKLGESIEEYTYEEFQNTKNNKDISEGIDFEYNPNKKELYNNKNNLYTEFSDDDLPDVINTALDQTRKNIQHIKYLNFTKTHGITPLDDEFLEKFVEDNSFIKKNGKD